MNLKTILLTFITLCILVSSCEKERFINDPGNLVPKTADLDPSIPSIQINEALFHAEAFGPKDSTLIFVLHGGPGADYRYLLNCKDLALEHFRVVFYDQRGTGLSQRFPFNTYNMDQTIADLNNIIEFYRTNEAQKVILLGHSWGAMLATAYINQYPEKVDGAILAEPGGFIWQDVEDYISRSRSIGFFSEDLNDAVYMEQFITGREDDHAILDYKFGLWSSAEESSPIGNEGPLPFWRGGAVTFNALFDYADENNPDWTTDLDKFKTNVLFIYSENNKAYGLNHAKKVSSAYPNVTLFQTNDAGHDMFSFPRGWNNSRPEILNYLNSIN